MSGLMQGGIIFDHSVGTARPKLEQEGFTDDHFNRREYLFFSSIELFTSHKTNGISLLNYKTHGT
jgi:hypothetical protein